MAVGNLANTLGTATGVWSNGQLVAGEPGNVSNEATSFATMTPQQYLQYLQQLAESPTGQAAQRVQNQTSAMNIKTALAQIEQGRRQLEIQAGTAQANAWAQQQQVKLAQQAHELAVQTQQQNYEIAQGNLTGTFQGQPTLAAIGQNAQYSGVINGMPTLQAQNQQQQFGLQQGGLLGTYQGQMTLPALQQQQANAIAQGNLGVAQGNLGVNQANVSGYLPNGMQTLANTQFQAGASGYMPNGSATLSREQAAAGTALQAGQLAASLQGPSKWPAFLQAQNGIAGSAASNLVSSAPGGLGAASGSNPPPMTLASVLGSWGVAPQQGSGQGGAPNYQMPGGLVNMPTGVSNVNPNAPQNVYAGGSPNFNEATGQYVQGQQGYTPQQQQQWAAQADPMTQQQPWWQQQNAGNPYVQQGGASGRGNDAMAGGAPAQFNEGGQAAGGWNPYSPTGAIGQVMSAPRVTNAQLGLSDQEAGTLQNYFNAPNSQQGTFWASKSPDQKAYLGGLNEYWGGSNPTFQYKERNSRPTQGMYNAA